MRLMISGSRTAITEKDVHILRGELDKLQPTHILHGGAKGADEIAEQWANDNGIQTTVIKPNYIKYGKYATHQRNDELILKSEKVLCYYGTNDGTKTPGTASVAIKAQKQNKLIAEIYRTEKTQTQISLF